MIAIPEQGDASHRLWTDLLDLGRAFPGQWTLIGAHMVALYAWEAGVTMRPSEDVDVLANVRLRATSARDIARFLTERSYEPQVSRDRVAHLFRRADAGDIDLFVPDGLGRRARMTTLPPNRTIQVPGGSQALTRSGAVEVQTRDQTGEIYRPSLLGALILKLRAIDVDDVPDAQRSDVARLLSLVADPDDLRSQLTRSDTRTLERHSYFADPGAIQWARLPVDHPEAAALTYRRLLN